MNEDWPKTREITVPPGGAGLRLDRLLHAFFKDWSRTELVKGIKQGLVCDVLGRPMRPSSRVRGGQKIVIGIPGIAPTEAPPVFPPILFEDDIVVVVLKPAGMVAHPSGSAFTWSVITLARLRWPEAEMDLCHRLDKDTSGVLVLTKEKKANQSIKQAFKAGSIEKRYEAICKGVIPWEERVCTAPIGPRGEEIRVQQGVREDGASAVTTVRVLERSGAFSRVCCLIGTGRTHQIRVHLDHLGFPIVGDRLYGVPPEVFLHTLKHGQDEWARAQTGAPRHALHCMEMRFPHPNKGWITVTAPVPEDMERWWQQPSCLPHDSKV